MFRFKIRLCSLTLACFLSFVAPAFAFDGGSLCDALLTQGIRDTQTLNVSNSQFNEIHSQVCNANYDSYSSAQSSSANGGLDVPGYFGISAADANADSEYSAKWSNFCSSDYGKSMSDGQLNTFVSTINAGLLHSFDHCVDLNSQTFIRYVQPDASGKIFTIVLDDRADGIPSFTITQLTLIDTTSGHFLDPTKDCDLPHKVPYPSGGFNHVNILCQKPAADDVVVSGATTVGLIDTITVPGVPSAPPSIADRVSTLEDQVSGLTNQFNKFESDQVSTNIGINNRLTAIQVDAVTHVTPNNPYVKHDVFTQIFPFPVEHTWIVPVGNYTNMDSIRSSITGTYTVTVTSDLHGTGPGGTGIIEYQVFATSF